MLSDWRIKAVRKFLRLLITSDVSNTTSPFLFPWNTLNYGQSFPCLNQYLELSCSPNFAITLLHAWCQALSHQSEPNRYLLWSGQRDPCCRITICKQCVYLASTIKLTAKWKLRDLGGLKSLRKREVSEKHLFKVETPYSELILYYL